MGMEKRCNFLVALVLVLGASFLAAGLGQGMTGGVVLEDNSGRYAFLNDEDSKSLCSTSNSAGCDGYYKAKCATTKPSPGEYNVVWTDTNDNLNCELEETCWCGRNPYKDITTVELSPLDKVHPKYGNGLAQCEIKIRESPSSKLPVGLFLEVRNDLGNSIIGKLVILDPRGNEATSYASESKIFKYFSEECVAESCDYTLEIYSRDRNYADHTRLNCYAYTTEKVPAGDTEIFYIP